MVGVFTLNDQVFDHPERLDSDVPQVVLSAQFDDGLRGIKLTPRAAAQLGARLIDLGLGMMEDAPAKPSGTAVPPVNPPAAPCPVVPDNKPAPPAPNPPKTDTRRGYRKGPAPNTIGFAIRARREALGLKSVDLADKIGVSNVSLNQWELNYAPPPEHRRVDLAAALNMPADWLKVEIEQERNLGRSEQKKRPGASVA